MWKPSKRQEEPAQDPVEGGETEQPSEEDHDASLEKRGEINQTPSTWGLGTISHRKKGFKDRKAHV